MGSAIDYYDAAGILGICAPRAEWPNSANAFLVPDEKGFTLIDAGCGGEGGVRHLADGLSHWGASPSQIHTVVCSHAHPDHMGALKWLLQQTRPRLWIHRKDRAAAENPSLLEDTFDIPLAKRRWLSEQGDDRFENFSLLQFFRDFECLMNGAAGWETFAEGDRLPMGRRRFQVIHTPGHSPGHVSFFEETSKALLGGDIVGKSPAWYTPTSGGVIGYLESLDKVDRLGADVLLPSHGTLMENPAEAIENVRGKLLRREEILLEALAEKPRRFMQLLTALFPSPILHFFPGIGILESHLQKLIRDRKIEVNGQQFRSIVS